MELKRNLNEPLGIKRKKCRIKKCNHLVYKKLNDNGEWWQANYCKMHYAIVRQRINESNT